MQITHLGHACVLVEAAGSRVLFDPGTFTDAWRQLTGLDAIVVTHQHPDHFDTVHTPALLAANPDALVLLEPELYTKAGRGEPFASGEQRQVGAVTLTAVGGRHAVIHRDIPGIGNVGVVLEAPVGEEGQRKRFFHPGDSLETAPEGIDVVAVPAYGPWAAMKETIDFVRAVGADHGFCIHEGLLNERGWKLGFDRFSEMSQTTFHDLRDGTPLTVD